jgi:hypothetical protein
LLIVGASVTGPEEDKVFASVNRRRSPTRSPTPSSSGSATPARRRMCLTSCSFPRVSPALAVVRACSEKPSSATDSGRRWPPDPPKQPAGSMVGREGVAAAAVALRWGWYLAVLLDRDKALWPDVGSPGTSRISDEEMARINIEASAALAESIDIYRADRGGRRYEQLVNRAVAYLPMPKKRAKLKVTELGARAQPEMAARALELAAPAKVERVRADAEQHPSRLFANALLNTAWRDGPVESIHAGDFRGYPLDQRG